MDQAFLNLADPANAQKYITNTAPSAVQLSSGADASAAGASDAGLPQYSWGLDPATGQWSYFMNKAGSQSAQIGRKAGDKLASYAADKHDAASIQQQALNHLLNTQATVNTPTTAPAAPQTNVAGSGIAAAASTGGGGHGAASDGGGGDSGTYGDGAGIGGLAAGLGNLGQTLGDTKLGRALGWISDKLAANNQPNYSNEGLHSGIDPNAVGMSGQSGDAGGDTQASAAGAGPASPMGTDPATAAANAAARDAQYSPGGDLGPQGGASGLGAVSAAGAGPASSMSTDPATAASRDSSSTESGTAGNGMSGTESNPGKSSDDHATSGSTYAAGGPVAGLHAAASLPPRFIRGPGDGQSDSIPVSMSDGGQGHLADNEFVVPADAVSALGSGSSEAGARALYEMIDRIRHTAHGSTEQAKPVTPGKVMPV